jgi:hypothetical protein
MTTGTIHRPKRLAGTPELIFRWRGTGQPLVPKLLAVAIAVGVFMLLMSVRVNLKAPEKTISQKASIIHLGDDLESRALSLRAREGGPFPSDFKVSDWDGLAEIEGAALDAVRFRPRAYEPVLEDLPSANRLKPHEFAAKAQAFFPKRTAPAIITPPEISNVTPTPVLYPLAGSPAGAIPVELPPFVGVADVATGSDSARFPQWRFILRLNSSGSVIDCVSLDKGGQPGVPALEAWLRRVQFKPEPAKSSRWIALGVGFTNQPADGPDAR